jgi:hypothetical protein
MNAPCFCVLWDLMKARAFFGRAGPLYCVWNFTGVMEDFQMVQGLIELWIEGILMNTMIPLNKIPNHSYWYF